MDRQLQMMPQELRCASGQVQPTMPLAVLFTALAVGEFGWANAMGKGIAMARATARGVLDMVVKALFKALDERMNS